MPWLAAFFAVFGLLVLPASSTAQAAFPQVPISIIEQTLTVTGCSEQVSATGGQETSVSFAYSCGEFTATGALTSSNADDMLTISLNALTGSGGFQDSFRVSGNIAFTVPNSVANGFSLPTTTMVGTLTGTPNSVGVTTDTFFVGLNHHLDSNGRPFTDKGSSLLLGSGIESNDLAFGLREDAVFIGNRATKSFDWLAGDEVTIPFFAGGGVIAQASANVNKTATFELSYVPLPEPSTSLTIPAGIGLLAGLARLRGVPLVP